MICGIAVTASASDVTLPREETLYFGGQQWGAVNETVWTNFPSADDGRNIPPADCTDGYGIAALYELELVG